MEKLKLIEAAEQEERQLLAAEEEAKNVRKGKKKKGKHKSRAPDDNDLSTHPSDLPAPPRISHAPPTLPVFESPLAHPRPEANHSDSDSEDEPAPRKAPTILSRRWSSGSSEAGRGKRIAPRPSSSNLLGRREDSDDEDLPLAATIGRALDRQRSQAGDSDDELPLSTLVKKGAVPSIHPLRDEDEDNQPLGLRASRIMSPAPKSGDDDDLPLGLHPEHQRRSQYNSMLMVQQQQQQQQMMFAQQQAQLQSAMFLNPPSMSGFFNPMMGPMPSPIIPGHDATKLNSVDKWRQNVAVEGSE